MKIAIGLKPKGRRAGYFLLRLFSMYLPPGYKGQEKEKIQAERSWGPDERERKAAYLLDAYGDGILRLGYCYFHNIHDAEDLLQDTMLRYLHGHPPFESRQHEKAWLMKVAVNRAKDMLAYKKLREADVLDETLCQEGRNDLSFVWEAVRKLPVRYREVIHLYYKEGYSTEEIGKILGKKEATVRSCMLRGRRRLKAILKEEFDFE